MKCPSCTANLSHIKVSAVPLDICDHGCGGIWFDEKELSHFDEWNEFNVDKLLFPQAKGKGTIKSKRQCPKCSGEVLAVLKFGTKSSVEIDQCFNCAGIWLDAGELSAIRAQYPSAAERQVAGDEFLAQSKSLLEDQFRRARLERHAEIVTEERSLSFVQTIILKLMRVAR